MHNRSIFNLIFCVGLLNMLACSSTDIPITPGEPFAQNRIWVTNNADPRPGTTLSGGRVIEFNFDVAFTLVSEIDVENRTNNVIILDFVALDSLGRPVSLGGLPDRFFVLGRRSGIFENTLSMLIPAHLTAVGLEIYLAQLNIGETLVLASDFRSWQVSQ